MKITIAIIYSQVCLNLNAQDLDSPFNPHVTEIKPSCGSQPMTSKNLNPWNTDIKFCSCSDQQPIQVSDKSGFCEVLFDGEPNKLSTGLISQNDSKRMEFSFMDHDGMCCNKNQKGGLNMFQCLIEGLGCRGGTYQPDSTDQDYSLNPRVKCIDVASQQGDFATAQKSCGCRDFKREVQQAQMVHAASILAMASSADQRPDLCDSGGNTMLQLEIFHRQRIATENGAFYVNNGIFFRCVTSNDLSGGKYVGGALAVPTKHGSREKMFSDRALLFSEKKKHHKINLKKRKVKDESEESEDNEEEVKHKHKHNKKHKKARKEESDESDDESDQNSNQE